MPDSGARGSPSEIKRSDIRHPRTISLILPVAASSSLRGAHHDRYRQPLVLAHAGGQQPRATRPVNRLVSLGLAAGVAARVHISVSSGGVWSSGLRAPGAAGFGQHRLDGGPQLGQQTADT